MDGFYIDLVRGRQPKTLHICPPLGLRLYLYMAICSRKPQVIQVLSVESDIPDLDRDEDYSASEAMILKRPPTSYLRTG
jgi:hypothetical protein